LLCKGDDVLWVCGMRVSEKLRAKTGTITYKLTMK
jgi:hypothetical protein